MENVEKGFDSWFWTNFGRGFCGRLGPLLRENHIKWRRYSPHCQRIVRQRDMLLYELREMLCLQKALEEAKMRC